MNVFHFFDISLQIKDLKEKLHKSKQREQELMEQISVPLDKNIENLMKQLETQHRDLLYQQLLCIKREYKLHTVTCPEESADTLQQTDSGTDKANASNTQLFTVTQTFDNSTDQEEDEADTVGIGAQENDDSIKLAENSVDSANVVCINYNSLPIDSAGNFQVTHHLTSQADECGSGEEGVDDAPPPKRFKPE